MLKAQAVSSSKVKQEPKRLQLTCELRPPKELGKGGLNSQVVSTAKFGSMQSILHGTENACPWVLGGLLLGGRKDRFHCTFAFRFPCFYLLSSIKTVGRLFTGQFAKEAKLLSTFSFQPDQTSTLPQRYIRTQVSSVDLSDAFPESGKKWELKLAESG